MMQTREAADELLNNEEAKGWKYDDERDNYSQRFVHGLQGIPASELEKEHAEHIQRMSIILVRTLFRMSD